VNISVASTVTLLRPGQHIDGMIGREHNYHLLGASIFDLACEFLGACGRRECEVMDIQVETASIFLASDLGVRPFTSVQSPNDRSAALWQRLVESIEDLPRRHFPFLLKLDTPMLGY